MKLTFFRFVCYLQSGATVRNRVPDSLQYIFYNAMRWYSMAYHGIRWHTIRHAMVCHGMPRRSILFQGTSVYCATQGYQMVWRCKFLEGGGSHVSWRPEADIWKVRVLKPQALGGQGGEADSTTENKDSFWTGLYQPRPDHSAAVQGGNIQS